MELEKVTNGEFANISQVQEYLSRIVKQHTACGSQNLACVSLILMADANKVHEIIVGHVFLTLGISKKN